MKQPGCARCCRALMLGCARCCGAPEPGSARCCRVLQPGMWPVLPDRAAGICPVMPCPVSWYHLPGDAVPWCLPGGAGPRSRDPPGRAGPCSPGERRELPRAKEPGRGERGAGEGNEEAPQERRWDISQERPAWAVPDLQSPSPQAAGMLLLVVFPRSICQL